MADRCEVDAAAELRRTHDLETLAIRLEHAVLDAVVHHLHEVPGAGRPDPQVSVFGSERQEDRFEPLADGFVAADHQAVAFFESPDAARYAGIDEADALA